MAENLKSSLSVGSLLRKSKPLWLSLLSCLTLNTPAHAQGDSVAVKINFIAWGDAITGLSLKSEGAGATFRAESFTYSDSVNYRGPAVLEIFQSAAATSPTEPPASANPVGTAKSSPAHDKESQTKTKSPLAQELEKRREKDPSLVALAKIPAGCTRATILLQSLGDGTYHTYVINDDPSQLPPGKLRIQNLSPYNISIKVATAEKPFQLAPNQQLTLPAENDNLIYELSYLKDKEWIYQENNIVRVSPQEQTQMIVLRSENDFFVSTGGSVGGFLQNVVLRRSP